MSMTPSQPRWTGIVSKHSTWPMRGQKLGPCWLHKLLQKGKNGFSFAINPGSYSRLSLKGHVVKVGLVAHPRHGSNLPFCWSSSWMREVQLFGMRINTVEPTSPPPSVFSVITCPLTEVKMNRWLLWMHWGAIGVTSRSYSVYKAWNPLNPLLIMGLGTKLTPRSTVQQCIKIKIWGDLILAWFPPPPPIWINISMFELFYRRRRRNCCKKEHLGWKLCTEWACTLGLSPKLTPMFTKAQQIITPKVLVLLLAGLDNLLAGNSAGKQFSL